MFSIAKSLPCILSNHNEQWFQFKGWSFHESMVRSLFDDKGYPKRKASGILLFVLLALLRGMPFVSKEDYSLHRQPPWKPMVCLTFWSEAIFLEATSTLHLLVQFQTELEDRLAKKRSFSFTSLLKPWEDSLVVVPKLPFEWSWSGLQEVKGGPSMACEWDKRSVSHGSVTIFQVNEVAIGLN